MQGIFKINGERNPPPRAPTVNMRAFFTVGEGIAVMWLTGLPYICTVTGYYSVIQSAKYGHYLVMRDE